MTGVSQHRAYPRLKNHLISSTGLAFYADRDQELSELIGRRVSDLSLPDCSAYAELLANGAGGQAEMELLTAQLTIGETYFFRDPDQFAAIRDIILPDILERNKASRVLRIWSAGCATGAEPYSLAILLERELAGRIAGWQVSIYATDLNRNYLTQAAEGKFQEWALRSTADEVKRECFSNEGRVWTISPRYKSWISFDYRNLVESEVATPPAARRHFDLILCRNVMIYFAPEVNSRLIGQFHESLEDGGWLVVGASESNLENYTAFRAVDAPWARLYQKIMTEEEAFGKKPAGGPAADQGVRPTLPGDIEGLRHLADRGDWQGAAEYARRLLTQDRLNPAIHFHLALILENLGIVTESERSLRHAIYLDRNFALAHYHLGLGLKRDGQADAATRSFRNVLKVLASTPGHTIVKAGIGVTAAGLRECAKTHLDSTGGA